MWSAGGRQPLRWVRLRRHGESAWHLHLAPTHCLKTLLLLLLSSARVHPPGRHLLASPLRIASADVQGACDGLAELGKADQHSGPPLCKWRVFGVAWLLWVPSQFLVVLYDGRAKRGSPTSRCQ
jgi:hypothetical protein